MNKKITLACADCGSRNYSTVSNKQTNPDRLLLNKFCKVCGKQTIHQETK